MKTLVDSKMFEDDQMLPGETIALL